MRTKLDQPGINWFQLTRAAGAPIYMTMEALEVKNPITTYSLLAIIDKYGIRINQLACL